MGCAPNLGSLSLGAALGDIGIITKHEIVLAIVGGHLVLAGILERQEAELIQAYAPHIKLSVADREDGWILMTAQRGTTA